MALFTSEVDFGFGGQVDHAGRSASIGDGFAIVKFVDDPDEGFNAMLPRSTHTFNLGTTGQTLSLIHI